jgi:hypothetical protein
LSCPARGSCAERATFLSYGIAKRLPTARCRRRATRRSQFCPITKSMNSS